MPRDLPMIEKKGNQQRIRVGDTTGIWRSQDETSALEVDGLTFMLLPNKQAVSCGLPEDTVVLVRPLPESRVRELQETIKS